MQFLFLRGGLKSVVFVRKISKEMKVSLLLLSVPLLLSLVFLLPKHEEYETIGDIVSVEELGIKGSVHFTYVNSGVTNNLYEKWSMQASYDDIQFTPISSYTYENYYNQTEEMDYYKEQTVLNAVYNPVFEQTSDSSFLYSKMNDILDNSSSYIGDSFGLMTAIGLYEEVYNKNYSRKYSIIIAGTGTMDSDYSVGEVGAIRQKLLTAEQNQVDIFFIPKHHERYNEDSSNRIEAFEVVKEEDLSLIVVPVTTLEDAIYYLENLDVMKGGGF